MDKTIHKMNFKPIIIRDLFIDKNPSTEFSYIQN
jgi:hypothetical protein